MKKVMLLLILLIGFLQACSYHHDPWTREDTYRHIAVTGLTVIDWQQTCEIADNPDQYYERNFYLGEHPSKSGGNIGSMVG